MYEVVPLGEQDLTKIRSFLQRVFETPDDHPPFRAEVLQWKAFAPHPYWPASRSYGVWHEGHLIAHGVMLPLFFVAPSYELSVNCVIDWAADSSLRGGGVAVYMALAKLFDLQIGVGGSTMARATLPRMRFREHQKIGFYERRDRIVAHHLNAPLDLKTPARIARDVWRKLQRPQVTVTFPLTARRVDAFAKEPNVPMPTPHGGGCSKRTPAFLDYMLHCPAAKMEGYVLETGGRVAGYCVLARVGRSCRIADLWIEGPPALESWDAAAALAAQLALSDPSTTSTMAAASTPFLRTVFERQGFLLREEQPLFVLGKKVPEAPIQVSLLDNDAFYLP